VPNRRRVEVLVVGAGPAGIAAATVASELDAKVTLLDSGIRPGGQIWRHSSEAQVNRTGRRWLQRLRRSGVEFIPSATVIDCTDRVVLAEIDGVPRLYAADRIVIATGARELFLPFPGWTLPNVIGLGGAQALIKAGTSFAAKRVIVAGSGPLVLAVSALLASKGAQLATVAEQASTRSVAGYAAGLWRTPQNLLDAARYRIATGWTRYQTGVWVKEAVGVSRVEYAVLTNGLREWVVGCDVLCAAYGLTPNIELAQAVGCDIQNGLVAVDDAQRTSVDSVFCAGEPTGIAGVENAIAQGVVAGNFAASRAAAQSVHSTDAARRLAAAFAPRQELFTRVTGDTILCRCEDVVIKQVSRCNSAREAKLICRAGMGPCQARVCGPAMHALFGWTLEPSRAPIFPATLATLAGMGGLADSPRTESHENEPV
jgi:D-hydroxyproline dehydrogenase subunit alpha